MKGARWLCTGVAVMAGVAVGAAVMAAVERPAPAPAPPAAGGVVPVTVPAASAASAAPVDALQGGEQTLLVWTPSRLPLSLGAGVSRLTGVDRVTTVRGGLVPMVGSSDGEGQPVDHPAPGWSIGLDTMVYDPATYPAFLPASVRPVFERLRPDQAILGASSAQLRRLGVGGTVQVGGGVGGSRPAVLTVAAVVDDRFVGATELTVSTAGADRLSPRMSDQYLLVGYHTDRVVLERSIRSLLPAGEAVRFRAPGETPFLRQGDAVLAQVFIKQRFGEFSYRLGPGKQIIEDPTWAADNIVVANVPVLGRVRCHRALIPLLQGALAELQRRNLAFLVDKASYEGCWNPVLINPGGELSRHAWGAAVDLNYAKNPTGIASGQDPRLVEVMARWGFTWGGGWLVPDPSHFEYVRPPQA